MVKAIYVDSSNELSLRDLPGEYHPQGGQALIKVNFSGINPADLAHPVDLGLNNYVAGYDMCGEVIEVGPTSRYKVGDIIYGSNNPIRGKPLYHGAHQDMAILESDTMSAKLPDHIQQTDAAALSIMTRTAGDALLNQFDLPFPAIGINGPPIKGGILIWGGGSTVGAAAIQLAKVMGIHPIYTTASASNHRSLLQMGATRCFAYQDPNVVDAIRNSAEKNGDIKFFFDTVGIPGAPDKPATTDQCEAVASAADALFATCLPQRAGPKWKIVFASRTFSPPVPGLRKNVSNLEWENRLEKVVHWAAANYGTLFRIPNVRVVEGGERGIKAIQDAFAGKNSLEKVVIQHPL